MRIGIFGDSFANWNDQNIPVGLWWEHFVGVSEFAVHATRGSSLIHSAMMLESRARDYDLAIWCVTSTSRFSKVVNDRWVHFQVTGPGKKGVTSHIPLDSSEEFMYGIVADYYKYIYTYHEDLLQSRALIDHLQRRFGNVMVIPCFRQPLDLGFCLNDVSQMEWSHYFPNRDFSDISKKYEDIRAGHITLENQKILCRLIESNLRPGIFQANIKDFVSPQGPVEQHFRKI